MRLRAAGGSVGSRVRRTGFLRLGRSKDRRSAAEATVIVDHAEAAHQSQFRFFHLPVFGFAGELPDPLHHTEKSAGSAGLADRELPARGIERKASVVREAVLAHE